MSLQFHNRLIKSIYYPVHVPTRNKFLPSARDVSLMVHTDSDIPHPHLMAVTAIWGEFVYHDASHTPQMAGYLGRNHPSPE